jgi:hypothetical protein
MVKGKNYPKFKYILLFTDLSGYNLHKSRVYKDELQKFWEKSNIEIRISNYPPEKKVNTIQLKVIYSLASLQTLKGYF